MNVVIGLLAVVAILGAWLFVPSEQRVHRIGRGNAERLFDSLLRC